MSAIADQLEVVFNNIPLRKIENTAILQRQYHSIHQKFFAALDTMLDAIACAYAIDKAANTSCNITAMHIPLLLLSKNME